MKENWVPLKYDLMAKKVFGDKNNTKPIKYLLKQILDIEAKSIKVLNNEIVGIPYKDKKYSVDLLVEIENKVLIGVEINTDVSTKIIDRNIFYMARIMSRDLKPNEDYSNLKKHIQINFDFEGYHERGIMRYKLRDEKTGVILTEKMEIIRIDVPYFYDRCYNKDASRKEKFIGLFNEENKIKAKELIVGDEDMKEIYDKVEEYSDDIIGLYDVESHKRENYKAKMEELEKESIERGMQKGIEKGIEKTKTVMVKNMISKNLSLELISEISGLSIDEINKLNENE